MGLTRNQKHIKRELVKWKIRQIKDIYGNKNKRKKMQTSV